MCNFVISVAFAALKYDFLNHAILAKMTYGISLDNMAHNQDNFKNLNIVASFFVKRIIYNSKQFPENTRNDNEYQWSHNFQVAFRDPLSQDFRCPVACGDRHSRERIIEHRS